MRLRKLWKAGILAMTLVIASANTCSVYASSILDTLTDEETSEDFSEDTSHSLLRGLNLSYGSSKISKLSSHEVALSSFTQCYHSCDTVYLTMYLERKLNGAYSTYKYWTFTANNLSHLGRAMNVIVPSGTYYRLRGYHAAKDGIKESTTTMTQGIWVG